MVSCRDGRDRGGKVVYNLLLAGLGVTLPYMESGLCMVLGETVVVKVRLIFVVRHQFSRATAALWWCLPCRYLLVSPSLSNHRRRSFLLRL